MGTKLNPGVYDCHARAEPDEPMFTLLARDPQAPKLVEQWAAERWARALRSNDPQSDDAKKALEAWRCAADMRTWRQSRGMPAAPSSDHAFERVYTVRDR